MNKAMFYVGLVFTIINVFAWLGIGIYWMVSAKIITLNSLGYVVYGIFTAFSVILMLLGVLTNTRK